MAGTRFACYTPVNNERGDPEAMRIVLPDTRGVRVGIWRSRFRVSNTDGDSWIQKENEAISAAARQLVESET